MRKILIIPLVCMMAMPLEAQEKPRCTPERIRELQVELDGIAAMRRMGGLDFARGICTVVRSAENLVGRFGGNILSYIDSILKQRGIDVPPNVVSDLCKGIHQFADDLAVGKREQEIKDELSACQRAP